MIADSLGQSASVSRLTCFHKVIRNRKESQGIVRNLQRSAERAMILSRQSLGQEPRELCSNFIAPIGQ